MMKPLLVGLLVAALGGGALSAKDRAWQVGHWRDSQVEPQSGGSVSMPIGNLYMRVPLDSAVQVVTIEGPDGLWYVGSRHLEKPWPLIVNDAVTFAVDGDRLYAQDPEHPKKDFWFTIIKRVRP